MSNLTDITIASIAALAITSPVSCSVYESSRLSAAAARGEDPMRLACAISPNTMMRSEVCMTLARTASGDPR